VAVHCPKKKFPIKPDLQLGRLPKVWAKLAKFSSGAIVADVRFSIRPIPEKVFTALRYSWERALEVDIAVTP
jgi:hypothetical protein